MRFVATTGGFPVLQMGDYPHAYMEEIKSRKFPPDLSIDPIRYEFHQPPLYYALLAPIYAAVRARCCRCDWPRCCWGWAWCYWHMRWYGTSILSAGAGAGHGHLCRVSAAAPGYGLSGGQRRIG